MQVDNDTPKTLDYAGTTPHEAPQTNLPAAISLAFGLAGLVFVFSMCSGMWQRLVPLVAEGAGWISAALAVTAVISGAIGALRAERDSIWYHLALLGYAVGMLVATLTPVFFML